MLFVAFSVRLWNPLGFNEWWLLYVFPTYILANWKAGFCPQKATDPVKLCKACSTYVWEERAGRIGKFTRLSKWVKM